jgi:lipoprotein-anchoring transpeptidase ErfK/SrfK
MHWWMTITRRWFFFAIAGMLLGSAVPPSSFASVAPRLAYADVDCLRGGAECRPHPLTLIVTAPPQVAAPPPAAADTPNWSELEAVAPASRESGGVRVVVSIPQQRLWAFRDGELFGTSPVSTGRKGHNTPVGTFRILQKAVHHRSNLYSNAPMPFMQKITHGGVALHAGHLPGYPASHGCIRLPWSFAKKLYAITDYGTPVTVTRERPKSPEEALALT